MKEVINLTEDFEQDSVAEWHDGDVWMMGCAVDGVEGFFLWRILVFLTTGFCVFGFGMAVGFCLQVSFFCFSCVQDRR
jgi:hypothetical protein